VFDETDDAWHCSTCGQRYGEALEPADWGDEQAHAANVSEKAQRKRDLMRGYIEGKQVLHLGAGGGNVGRPDDDVDWFHGWLDEVADRAVGIDVDAQAVATAQTQGYELVEADAQNFDMDAEFDVVAAPNIIEHVGDPGSLLECARDHLCPDGRLLITTDRITVPWWTLQAIRNGGCPETHPDHVVTFTRDQLRRLFRRRGLREVAYQSWGFDRSGVTGPDRAWRVVERQLARLWPTIEHVQHFAVAAPEDEQ
jgi:SAM-dependent methyltransferase